RHTALSFARLGSFPGRAPSTCVIDLFDRRITGIDDRSHIGDHQRALGLAGGLFCAGTSRSSTCPAYSRHDTRARTRAGGSPAAGTRGVELSTDLDLHTAASGPGTLSYRRLDFYAVVMGADVVDTVLSDPIASSVPGHSGRRAVTDQWRRRHDRPDRHQPV